MTVQSVSQAVPSSRVLKRYNDAYRVAAATIMLGTVAQIIGIVLALLIGVGGCIAAVNMFSRYREEERYGTIAASVVVAILAFAIFYIIGVWVRAQGQTLRASLDGAVHSSPFLSDGERASAMRL